MAGHFQDIGILSFSHIWALNFAIGKSSRSYTYPLFLPQRIEMELILDLRAEVSEIRVDFQHCHIWAWNLAISQSFRSCTCISFLPQGVETELIFDLWAVVSELRVDFQNCHIWIWNLVKVPEAVHILTLYARGLTKLSLFSLYRQWFPRYRVIFKISIFGHETWPLGHWQKIQIYPLSTQGSKLSLFSLYAVSEIWADFQNCHIWAWNLTIGQSSRTGTYTPYTTPESQFHSVLLYGWLFQIYWQFFIFPLATMLNFNLILKK